MPTVGQSEMCVLSHFASAHLLLRSLSSHLISSVLSSSQLKVQRQKTTGAVRFSVSQTEAAAAEEEERTKLQANASACASRLNEPAAAVPSPHPSSSSGVYANWL